MSKVNIGIIGLGTVGRGVVRTLLGKASALRQKAGAGLQIRYICDIDPKKKKALMVKNCLFSTDAKKVVNDPNVDIVVELIGGLHPAREIIMQAMKNGKHVVTANKALLAQDGRDIFKVACDAGVEIYFEAAVCGGIPIIKAIREGLAGNRIDSLMGILNGTSNYILTQMRKQNINFKEALKEAQGQGFAERMPALDVKGIDATHKLILLAYFAFGKFISMKDVYVDGIVNISPSDLVYAEEFGYVIKPLAIAKRVKGEIETRVHPTLLPKEHLLSNVSGVYNAVFVRTDLAGDLLFYGRGAGEGPAASAVVSDIVGVARNIRQDSSSAVSALEKEPASLRLKKMSEIETRYYIRFSAIDKPGVLAKISGILGKHKISIATVAQKERREAQIVPIVMMTHEAKESSLQTALEQIDRLSVVKAKSVVIRMEK